MNYLQITVGVPTNEVRDILIAQLAEQGFEGFEETDAHIKAFINQKQFEQIDIQPILAPLNLSYQSEVIEPTNWNEQWESNFSPVNISTLCNIRAHFHPKRDDIEHDIIITPKMSFGTGHHATTRLMIENMAQLNLNGKTVLDFGTGTGILAIYAEKLGAQRIDAIDNDEWSYTNAQENLILNHAEKISVSTKSIEALDTPYEVILANINRHILLEYMPKMNHLLQPNGVLLMSGLLKEDEAIISESAESNGFRIEHTSNLNNWISVKCHKA